ncbi:hypothetical protein O181_026781 [Austropuccinia psidii MF-1]|uniref:Reverse transcriptase/retrotransposon-derived protein RNase H-like domain-containing protein n=1 Tax=Austropuccinia psidii MF-1 TaxID=1389203 RepID=A0A9Q3CL26_9BASI|nr:hypothetical protein [Austropuccinia psidii MF-1]
MGDTIIEQADKEKDPREEFLLKYQEETPIEIQDIQLEEGIQQDTTKENLCKHTQDAQTLLVTLTQGMVYIHGTATKITVCIDNSQDPLIIDSGAHCSKVARNYLEKHFPNWQKQLFPTKEKNFKSASGKMISFGTIIKEIIIPHKKGFLLRTDYQIRYGIDIYNSKSRHITIGTNKQNKFSLHIYQICAQDPLEKLLNEFREGQFSTTLTSKQKLTLLKMLRKNRPEFVIGEEPLGKIRGHDIELSLDVEIPYPPMLRRPPYPASLETRKEVEKHINELLDMDVIRTIGHKEIVEITTPVLITWHHGKYRLCGDFRALNNYTEAEGYPIPRITHALDKLEKAKYITKMDCMEGFHRNEVKPNSIKLLRIVCHMGIYEYTRMPFGIKKCTNTFPHDDGHNIPRINIGRLDGSCNFGQQEQPAPRHKVSGLSLAIDRNKVAEVLQKPVQKSIKEMQYFLGFSSYYRNHIKTFAHMTSSLYKVCSKYVVFEITKERRDAYDRIKHELTNAPVLILPEFKLPFKLYIDAAFSQGLGEALHQRKILDFEPREEVICYISRQLKDSESRCGANQTECLCLVWDLEKLHYYLEGAVFESYCHRGSWTEEQEWPGTQ